MSKQSLSELIKKAENGEHLWFSDLRKAFDMFGNERIVLRPVLFDCSCRDLELYIPQPSGDNESSFLREYLARNIFNALSVLGGQSMSIYFNRRSAWLASLVSEAAGIVKNDPAYSRVIDINNNMASALGWGRHYFSMLDLSSLEPASEPDTEPYEYLPQKLVKCAQNACKGRYLGLDVGGSDIKLIRAVEGEIDLVREYDWDPESYPKADMITGPIVKLAAEASDGKPFDAIGISFPDICCGDRIVGGQTPKTRSLREAYGKAFPAQLAKISALGDLLRPYAKPGAPVKIINDGHMSAFTAAAEFAAAGKGDLSNGVIAHSLGTDLGFGMIDSYGCVADMPQEFYDIFIDMGDIPSAQLDPEDIRSSRNPSSGLPDARKYMGQSAAFRFAAAMGIELMDDFTRTDSDVLRIVKDPDLRKPCLEALMKAADAGSAAECGIFREIGRNVGIMSREMQFLLSPKTGKRLVFGRFVKHPAVFKLVKEGCFETAPFIDMEAGDEGLANTALMKKLAARKDCSVAQFAQAVGAIHYALF